MYVYIYINMNNMISRMSHAVSLLNIIGYPISIYNRKRIIKVYDYVIYIHISMHIIYIYIYIGL